MRNPFRYFNSSPEVIRLAVMLYIRYPLSLRQVEDILFERGIDICHETLRYWWNRFAPVFAGEIRRRRVDRRDWSNWCRHLDKDEVTRVIGETQNLCREAILQIANAKAMPDWADVVLGKGFHREPEHAEN